MAADSLINSLIKTDAIWIALGIIVLFIYLKFKFRFKGKNIFNFKYKNLFLTILLPIILSFVFLTLFTIISSQSLSSGYNTQQESIYILIISVVIIGPFFEELFLRGIIFGGALFFSRKVENKFAGYFFALMGFLLQLFIFILIHNALNSPIRIIFLAASSLLYSLLFVFYKEDLLAPMIAHASANLFVLLGVFA